MHPAGNAPIAHLPADGGTTFYWRMLYVSGGVAPGEAVEEYAWLTRDEMAQRLEPAAAALAAEMCGPFD